MRTTLVLDDALIQNAKLRAVDERATLSEIVNRALREYLYPRSNRVAEAEVPYKALTYGDPSKKFRLEPEDIARMQEEEDLENLRRWGLA